MMMSMADYLLLLMAIRNGEYNAPPEVRKEAEERLKEIDEELKKEGFYQ